MQHIDIVLGEEDFRRLVAGEALPFAVLDEPRRLVHITLSGVDFTQMKAAIGDAIRESQPVAAKTGGITS